jgi:hypothetical protein
VPQILPARSHSTGIELPETLKEFQIHTTTAKAVAGALQKLSTNSRTSPLSSWHLDDLESQLGGFRLEVFDL